MKSMFEKMGGTYTQVGDFLLPNLYIESREEYHIGKYGRMRKRYLKEHHWSSTIHFVFFESLNNQLFG